MNKWEEEMLIKAAMSARLPWFSSDAELEYTFKTDPPELIEKCCHCTQADCVNCIANMTHEKQGRPKGTKKADLASFAYLLTKGLSQEQVCSLLGIGKRTFYNYKNQVLKGAFA